MRTLTELLTRLPTGLLQMPPHLLGDLNLSALPCFLFLIGKEARQLYCVLPVVLIVGLVFRGRLGVAFALTGTMNVTFRATIESYS